MRQDLRSVGMLLVIGKVHHKTPGGALDIDFEKRCRIALGRAVERARELGPQSGPSHTTPRAGRLVGKGVKR